MVDLKENSIVARSDIGGAKEISAPLVSIFAEAINEGATDIHLDPYDEGKLVRYRVDGVIHEKAPVPMSMRKRLLNQVKVLIDLDIDKSFVPEEHQVPAPPTVQRALGCEDCKEYGHKGRIAIFELTPIDQPLGQDIAGGIGTKELASRFETVGTNTIVQDLLHKVAGGDVSLDIAKRFIKTLGD